VTKSLMEACSSLKAIATATTGLDHIDLDTAKEMGVHVVSLRGERAFLDTITGTAELAFGMLIDLARLTHTAFESVKRYEWEMEKFKGHTLAGKTLGVVGLGRLGRMCARYGSAFGMEVIYTDPDEGVRDGSLYERVDFEELIERSDAISIHVHLKEDTLNMFNIDVIERMKQGCYLINTSRGRIANEEAVLSALESGLLGGYATDVLTNEIDFIKTFSNHPLVEYAQAHNNLIIVPHTGGLTYESRIATDMFVAEKLAKVLGS